MAKNILLLFLSDVKTKKLADGSVVISEAHYTNIDGENTQTTNESAIRYLLKTIRLDTIFIVASKKIHDNIRNYLDADGKPKTHLKFTTERFKKFVPDADFEIFNFDEDGTDNDNLKSIAKMAQRIQNLSTNENATLHVDLTGGMRHVNMIILELTRLLEYSGLKIGNIVYSKYDAGTGIGTIEEVQNIYDLFQLMAGVEEFVNFGSVKALKIYYVNKILSEPLTKLVDSMEKFSAAIKLCHYGQFRDSIQKLHDAVHDFDKREPENVEDVLMVRLIGRIRQNYHELIAIRDKDDLRVIRWCLDNDYLQQALTLFTERIPEYLGEKEIVTQSPEQFARLKILVKKDEMGRNPFFYLFSDFNPQKNLLGEMLSLYLRSLKVDAWKLIRKKNFDFVTWAEKLDEKLAPISIRNEERLSSQLEILAKIFQDSAILVDLQNPELEPIRKLLDELSPELEPLQKGFERRKVIAKFMDTAKVETLAKFFDGVRFAELMAKYPHARKIYELLAEEVFSVTCDTEKFLSIADKYFVIKRERNHCNHAHETSDFLTAKELREFMITAIDEIKSVLTA